jgi:hypothetical protein
MIVSVIVHGKGQVLSDTLPTQIVGRKKEIRRIARQIMTGQSSAILGAFSNDRTLILDALRNEEPKQQAELYGDKADRFIFSQLDISSLDINSSPAQFWEKALKPLQDKVAEQTDSMLSKAYHACQNNQFDPFYIDKLFEQLKQQDLRLVLMLERFETLLQRPQLDSSEFLGGLRAFASSRYPSPLSLVIAGDMSLHQFHQDTHELNPMGSPYLNFMESGEMTLGALSELEIDKLLQQTDQPLTDADRRFIKEMAGGHPYLLQIATSVLWEAYDNQENNPIQTAEKMFSSRIKRMLNNILHSWQTNMRQAFFAVAQNGKLSDFKNELEWLEKQGFIINHNGQWQVRSRVFLDFVAEKTEQELISQSL